MSVRVLVGDSREVLRTLPDASVHCCVTSPPYFGLRSYDGCGCTNEGRTKIVQDERSDRHTAGGALAFHRLGTPDPNCAKCGGTGRNAEVSERQMGLEATPEEWVQGMVEVFREVRRILRPDGTLWLNIGDSYAGSGKGQNADGSPNGGPMQQSNRGSVSGNLPISGRAGRARNGLEGGTQTVDISLGGASAPGCKPKDLIGIPWMLAFALRADGWYLRSDIIWSKPNPMPESVTDRPTKAHEYLFLLSKSRTYFYDAAAIREEGEGYGRGSAFRQPKYLNGNSHNNSADVAGVAISSTFEGGRNKRSVWTVATEAFPESHFATYPTALIEPCIKAGCPEGGTVLDPFFGAGTTGLISDRLNRNCIGIEINPTYADMARRRIANDAPLFAGVPFEPVKPIKDKQGQVGSRTYTGFNARWDAKEDSA